MDCVRCGVSSLSFRHPFAAVASLLHLLYFSPLSHLPPLSPLFICCTSQIVWHHPPVMDTAHARPTLRVRALGIMLVEQI